ncbi:eukaryotic translation initiation factor 4E-binding protein 1-like [Littorina saxatilis]|uniref:Eukaryotic translation initiation factor 4E-binding protein 1 n=1 Tax=Littorina saxatilis TaxID=31220 RepID=A0AAN9BU68_9CAEN
MSSASGEPKVQGRDIPNRRVVLNDISQLPSEYSTTPGGTFFSTTPGGTRIVYERNFLLQCRNSPLAKSPPANMLEIPGITSPAKPGVKENGDHSLKSVKEEKAKVSAEDAQFEMDI